MYWIEFSGKITGTLIPGNPKSPTAIQRGLDWLSALIRKRISILSVPKGTAEYRVGFIPQNDKAKIFEKIITTPKFAVRNSHEDRKFFALNAEWKEIPLTLVEQTTKNKLPSDIPLI